MKESWFTNVTYEKVSGTKMHASYIWLGGVAQDMPLVIFCAMDKVASQAIECSKFISLCT
jgi:NADH:ubiquinone oxidoreductase subunit D